MKSSCLNLVWLYTHDGNFVATCFLSFVCYPYGLRIVLYVLPNIDVNTLSFHYEHYEYFNRQDIDNYYGPNNPNKYRPQQRTISKHPKS